jgi:predicted CopG family antitoxin
MVSRDSGKKDIAVENDFHDWLLNKKKGKEKSLEDCLRRLTGFKARKKK